MKGLGGMGGGLAGTAFGALGGQQMRSYYNRQQPTASARGDAQPATDSADLPSSRDGHVRTDWSAAFFERFYRDEATRITTSDELAVEGQWLAATLAVRLRVPISSAIDLGSGTGWFTHGLDHVLAIKTRRIDLHAPDEEAERIDIREVELEGHDLIVCRDVLHYFGDADAGELLRRMNTSKATAIYLRVASVRDQLTPGSDDQIHRKPARWYRDRLPVYASFGFGLFVRRDVPIALADLELPKH